MKTTITAIWRRTQTRSTSGIKNKQTDRMREQDEEALNGKMST